MSIFLACCLLLSINFETVFASDIETNTNADIMSLDGPSTTCVLSGRTGGIPTLYTIYIRWQGSNAVQALRADNLYIVGDSQYYSKGFLIDGLSATQGYRSIGTCVIPDTEESVYISTNNLRCYFYNEDYWIKFNEIGGWVDV